MSNINMSDINLLISRGKVAAKLADNRLKFPREVFPTYHPPRAQQIAQPLNNGWSENPLKTYPFYPKILLSAFPTVHMTM
jgi:hypothetical protein